jgi:DNA-binding transcriptional LysR family regulator
VAIARIAVAILPLATTFASPLVAGADSPPAWAYPIAPADLTAPDDGLPRRTVSGDGIGLVDAALGGCGIARPFDIAARHLIATGQLLELLADWTGERQAVTAVTPAYGRSTSAKVRLYMEHVASLLKSSELLELTFR